MNTRVVDAGLLLRAMALAGRPVVRLDAPHTTPPTRDLDLAVLAKSERPRNRHERRAAAKRDRAAQGGTARAEERERAIATVEAVFADELAYLRLNRNAQELLPVVRDKALAAIRAREGA